MNILVMILMRKKILESFSSGQNITLTNEDINKQNKNTQTYRDDHVNERWDDNQYHHKNKKHLMIHFGNVNEKILYDE